MPTSPTVDHPNLAPKRREPKRSYAADFNSMRDRIGFEIGLNTNKTLWSDDEISIVDRLIQSACQMVFTAYDWTWLRPLTAMTLWTSKAATAGTTVTGVHQNGVTRLTANAAAFFASMVGKDITVTGEGTFTVEKYVSGTVLDVIGSRPTSGDSFSATTWSLSADGDYRLADDFGGLNGELTYAAAHNRRNTIDFGPEGHIRRRRQANVPSSGTPEIAAVVPLSVSDNAETSQRWTLSVFPTPDTDFTVNFRYHLIPRPLSEDFPHPPGGLNAAELYHTACLAAAEKYVDGIEAVRARDWVKALAQAIGNESRSLRPEDLGNYRDRSARMPKIDDVIWNDFHSGRGVTINGVQY